jgi:hypothetical protein
MLIFDNSTTLIDGAEPRSESGGGYFDPLLCTPSAATHK